MRIVIIGASRFRDRQRRRKLIDTGHEVVLIDKDGGKLEHLAEELDCGFIGGVGDGSLPSVLRDAFGDHADALVALTNADDENILAALVGKVRGASTGGAADRAAGTSGGLRGTGAGEPDHPPCHGRPAPSCGRWRITTTPLSTCAGTKPSRCCSTRSAGPAPGAPIADLRTAARRPGHRALARRGGAAGGERHPPRGGRRADRGRGPPGRRTGWTRSCRAGAKTGPSRTSPRSGRFPPRPTEPAKGAAA